ncbi:MULTISPECIES: hypothetical protein [Aeromonas]|jgi:hypothetical protein|uniref:Uncharacterized protein n=1 Tax=Aeromonas hydrophila TaxID=644 RepID=A0AAX3P7J6_AERHY|nr:MULTISPECIES: hypothetical protein [Aeromonas]MCF5767934.1 hypothetical protein [Aeromonas veronii]WEE26764.1 hypothetical protein PY771_00065 [Aeromonas hydrophila]
MSEVYVNPMAMRARLVAELSVLDLYRVVRTTAASLSDWVGADGDSLPDPLVGEVNTSMVAMSAAVHSIGYRSADELIKRLAAFEDTGELVVQLLAELNQCDGLRREDLAVTRSAVLLLAMYGALALASREANADRDDEECLA